MFTVSASFRNREELERQVSLAKAAGFFGIEPCVLDTEQFSLLLSFVKRNNYPNIPTVHHPFGVPAEMIAEDYFVEAFSSLDESKRLDAVKAAKLSIANAASVGAKVVVVHMGYVEMQDDPRRIIELWREGQQHSGHYDDTLDALKKEREVKQRVHLEQVFRSLDELLEPLEKHDMCLGLENRYHPHEIPDRSDMELILDRYPSQRVQTWYDVGHSYVLEMLGYDKEEEVIRTWARKMIGAHIHDCVGISDHRLPGDGDIHWKMVISCFPTRMYKVLECRIESVEAGIEARNFLNSLQANASVNKEG